MKSLTSFLPNKTGQKFENFCWLIFLLFKLIQVFEDRHKTKLNCNFRGKINPGIVSANTLMEITDHIPPLGTTNCMLKVLILME